MSKYVLLSVLFIFLSVTGYVVQAVETYSGGGFSTSGVSMPAVDENASELQIAFQSLGAIFRLLTFQVSGVPNAVVILIFYPITIAFIYMLLDVIKDLVPFT